MSHTSGPWYYDKYLSAVVTISDYKVKAIADFGKIDNEESNAHLISAAPELLWCLSLALSPFDGKPDKDCPNWVKPARAAITKATGSAA